MNYRVLMTVQLDESLTEIEMRRLIVREIGERPEVKQVVITDCDPKEDKAKSKRVD